MAMTQLLHEGNSLQGLLGAILVKATNKSSILIGAICHLLNPSTLRNKTLSY